MSSATNTLLGHLLLNHGMVTAEELEDALQRQQVTKAPLGQILVTSGVLQQQELEIVLRAQTRLRGKGESNRAHILIIDDDPEVGAVVGDILAGAGYSVGVAQNGQEALAAIFAEDSNAPALIVLDLSMPGTSGFELLPVLTKSMPHPVPVVVLTGNDDRDVEARVRALGAREFLAKPAPARHLVQVIDNLLAEAASAIR